MEILGYYRKTAILLGIESRLEFYKQLTLSRADRHRPSLEISLLLQRLALVLLVSSRRSWLLVLNIAEDSSRLEVSTA